MMCKFKIKIADQSKRLPFFGNLYSLYPFFLLRGMEKSENFSAIRLYSLFTNKGLKIMFLSFFSNGFSLKQL